MLEASAVLGVPSVPTTMKVSGPNMENSVKAELRYLPKSYPLHHKQNSQQLLSFHQERKLHH